MYARAVNAFSATRPGLWLVAHVAARVDPSLFRWSGGRMTITGVPTLPMLVLTTTGRRSGLPRSCSSPPRRVHDQLAGRRERDGAGPASRLAAQPARRSARPVLLPGREVEVDAVELAPDERDRHWPDLLRTIPQMRTYVRRTTRDIPVVRLAAR